MFHNMYGYMTWMDVSVKMGARKREIDHGVPLACCPFHFAFISTWIDYSPYTRFPNAGKSGTRYLCRIDTCTHTCIATFSESTHTLAERDKGVSAHERETTRSGNVNRQEEQKQRS